MATFIMVCFLVFVLAFVAKLIYDVQQNKKSIKIQTNEITADEVDAFQKLAGIKPVDTNDELRQILVKNNLNTEKLTEELKKEFENSEFPAPDPSIPVITAKITTIDLNSKEDKDPLGSVPMSRVSNEAKQKMAEIAKQDISDRLEAQAQQIPTEIKEAMLNAEPISQLEYNLRRDKMAEEVKQSKCGCGRSETGFCTGLHRIPKADWENGVREIPQPKKKANPKQDIKGVDDGKPFKKTRKKTTKTK